MIVATIAGETRGLDRQHGAHAARANRGQEALEAGPVGAAARAAEVLVDDLDRRPAELTSAVGKGILPAPALPVVNELVRRRLADIDIGTARKMLSRDLRHGRPPRLRAPRRSRATVPPPASQAVPAAPTAARRAAPPRAARAGSVGDFPCIVSCPSSSVIESDGRKSKRASTSARRQRRASRGKRGLVRKPKRVAASCSIHAGNWASDPSGCSMTTRSTPWRVNRRLIDTVSPQRG